MATFKISKPSHSQSVARTIEPSFREDRDISPIVSLARNSQKTSTLIRFTTAALQTPAALNFPSGADWLKGEEQKIAAEMARLALVKTTNENELTRIRADIRLMTDILAVHNLCRAIVQAKEQGLPHRFAGHCEVSEPVMMTRGGSITLRCDPSEAALHGPVAEGHILVKSVKIDDFGAVETTSPYEINEKTLARRKGVEYSVRTDFADGSSEMRHGARLAFQHGTPFGDINYNTNKYIAYDRQDVWGHGA